MAVSNASLARLKKPLSLSTHHKKTIGFYDKTLLIGITTSDRTKTSTTKHRTVFFNNSSNSGNHPVDKRPFITDKK
jgi:hypothetical protein